MVLVGSDARALTASPEENPCIELLERKAPQGPAEQNASKSPRLPGHSSARLQQSAKLPNPVAGRLRSPPCPS